LVRAFPEDLRLIDALGRRYVAGWEGIRPWRPGSEVDDVG
jgi:hypothetical protein